MTITTNAMVSINSYSTSRTEARMVVVRSVSTLTCTEAGRLDCNCGSSSLMRSTTAMILAPGCVNGITATAGSSSKYPSLRRSSTESTTVDTSLKRTASPLR